MPWFSTYFVEVLYCITNWFLSFFPSLFTYAWFAGEVISTWEQSHDKHLVFTLGFWSNFGITILKVFEPHEVRLMKLYSVSLLTGQDYARRWNFYFEDETHLMSRVEDEYGKLAKTDLPYIRFTSLILILNLKKP